MTIAPHRIAPPKPPALSRRTKALLAERDTRLQEQTFRERFSLLRGLLWIAIFVLLASIARAGIGRAFVAGWWRQW